MKCIICKTSEAQPNSIVCSENCEKIRIMILSMNRRYTPTNGCDNCWGDLGGNCSQKCKDEFEKSQEFIGELYEIIRLAFNKK